MTNSDGDTETPDKSTVDLPAPAKDIPGYEPSDIHGRKKTCNTGHSHRYIYPETDSYDSPGSMPDRRIDDAPITRSDLLDLNSREFEFGFAILWNHYAEGDKERRHRFDKHVNSGVHTPANQDRGLDLITREQWADQRGRLNRHHRRAGHHKAHHAYNLFQLKQYDDTQVSAPEVQRFIGACMTFRSYLDFSEAIHKAYFVTTSTFTKPALDILSDFRIRSARDRSPPFTLLFISNIDTTILFRRVWGDINHQTLRDNDGYNVLNPDLTPDDW